MSFSIVISSALLNTKEEDVRTTFEQLELGVLEKIDIVPAQSRGNDCLKIFIHYKSATPVGERLRAKLEENKQRQEEGAMVPQVKVCYGTTRDGRDRYWQIYAAQTPAQRMASLAKKTGFKARIEM